MGKLKGFITALVAVAIVGIFLTAFNKEIYAAETSLRAEYSLRAVVSAGGTSQVITTSIRDGKEYLLLPGFASDSQIVFRYDGKGSTLSVVNGTSEIPLNNDSATDLSGCLSNDVGNGSRKITINVKGAAGNVKPYDLYIMKSSAISSMYITSADPAKGITFVEASKTNKATGSMTMLTATGNVVYSGGLTQIKGRGNTTFATEKKPYQIKLATGADLALTGSAHNKDKTWILLANAYDPTLIHNTVGYRMAKKMGLDVPDCLPIDLYYDGMYRGNYLLTEKVELGAGRVPCTSLAKSNKKANGDKDLSNNPLVTGKNKYGNEIRYVNGVKNPDNISGGYLIEQDNAYYKGERCYFMTSIGAPFAIKSPENCSKEEVEFISEYVEEMIQAAANGGTCPTTGKNVWEYIDKDSFVKYYVFQEAIRNADAYASSTYYYLNMNGTPLVAGPVWDLDDSYGIREDRASAEGFNSEKQYMEMFRNLPDFRAAVKSYYNSKGYSIVTNTGIDSAVKEIAASQKMNRILWEGHGRIYQTLESYEADINYMKNYAAARAKWLKGAFGAW